MIAASLYIGGGFHLMKPAKLHVFTKHNTLGGDVPDIVSYPGTVASLNKHNWNKQTNNIASY